MRKGSACYDCPGYWMSANSVRGLYDKKRGLIVLFTWNVMRKSMFKRLFYTPPDSSPRFTYKKSGLIFILSSLLDRGMQRVNWLPPRTIVARVFLKIIFRGCPIIHSLSNGAMLERRWMPHYDATANANTINE